MIGMSALPHIGRATQFGRADALDWRASLVDGGGLFAAPAGGLATDGATDAGYAWLGSLSGGAPRIAGAPPRLPARASSA